IERITSLKHPHDLATALDISLARLQRELQRADVFPAQTLLAWLRVLCAARKLGDTDETVERIGLSLNYASGPAFRNTCHHLLHATPSEVRERGGLRYAGDRFQEAVGSWRARIGGGRHGGKRQLA
ncbi:MAG: AraC family transcriptional regulator, partial [Gemmatimonadetes bacterium]|nr:AraC family transcriptional regulator [Gemmatimonadota bacterium]